MNLSNELNTAREAALKAGDKIMEVYGRYVSGDGALSITKKSDNSPLTEADKAANAIIVPLLAESFPQYAMLSEESRDDLSRLKNKHCWIVDPLDGTKEFISKNGEFTVNIALAFENRVVLGVVYVPVVRELYYASKGNGAFLEENGKVRKISVSERTQGLRMVTSRSHGDERIDTLIEKYGITDTKIAGSSLKGCIIARGDAEVYYRYGKTMEWDTAAMQCIAEEAGAVFMQMDDTEMLYNRDNSLNEKGFYIISRPENKLTL